MDLSFDKDTSDFLVMYHGGILPRRNIESLIELVSLNKNIKAVLLGNGLPNYIEYLQGLIKKFCVEDRIIFRPAVPLKDLWQYVGAIDVGMILARATCKNALFSLPNKFFENIQSGTPVICPNYPAFRKIVLKYNNALLCNPDDINDINNCVERLRTDKELYKKLKENTIAAKEELNWEKERGILYDAYKRLIYE